MIHIPSTYTAKWNLTQSLRQQRRQTQYGVRDPKPLSQIQTLGIYRSWEGSVVSRSPSGPWEAIWTAVTTTQQSGCLQLSSQEPSSMASKPCDLGSYKRVKLRDLSRFFSGRTRNRFMMNEL